MQINFYATLRPLVGARTIDLACDDAITVRELIDTVVERYPALRTQMLDEHGALYSHVHVFVNGRDAPYLDNGVETRIAAHDTVDIFPAVAGG